MDACSLVILVGYTCDVCFKMALKVGGLVVMHLFLTKLYVLLP